MQITMVPLKIEVVFSIFIVFGNSSNHALNSYDVFAEIGGTVLLPCVEKLDKGCKNKDCIWTAIDSYGDSDKVIAANSSTPSPDTRFKIVGDWENGNCSLLLSSVKEKDKTTYSCKVYPSNHHVSNVQIIIGGKPKYLNIFYKEKDVTSEEHVEVPEGTDIKLKCVAKKDNPPANISWIGFDSNKTTYTTQVEEASSVLLLTSIDIPTNDERTFVCKAERPFYPGFFATVNVSIGYRYAVKEVKIWPLNNEFRRQLKCDANGIPRPDEYIWKRKEGQDWIEISGKKSYTYYPAKYGLYKCSAKNILNENFIESRREATVVGDNAAKLDFTIILMLSTSFLAVVLAGI